MGLPSPFFAVPSLLERQRDVTNMQKKEDSKIVNDKHESDRERELFISRPWLLLKDRDDEGNSLTMMMNETITIVYGYGAANRSPKVIKSKNVVIKKGNSRANIDWRKERDRSETSSDTWEIYWKSSHSFSLSALLKGNLGTKAPIYKMNFIRSRIFTLVVSKENLVTKCKLKIWNQLLKKSQMQRLGIRCIRVSLEDWGVTVWKSKRVNQSRTLKDKSSLNTDLNMEEDKAVT